MTFETAWSQYPRKLNKSTAMKAYTKAIKKGASDADIIAGIIRFREHVERNGTATQFIPHFSTYINQERWLDDLSGEATGTGHNGKQSQISNAMAAAVKTVQKAQTAMERDDRELGLPF